MIASGMTTLSGPDSTGGSNRANAPSLPFGTDVSRNLLSVDPLRRWPLAGDVVLLEAGAEIGDSRGGAAGLNFTERITATVDVFRTSRGRR